jgi:TolA-binding protein
MLVIRDIMLNTVPKVFTINCIMKIKSKHLSLIFAVLFLMSVNVIAFAQSPDASPSAESDPQADNDRVYYENGLNLLKMKSPDKALLRFGEYLELYAEGAYRKDVLMHMGDIYLSKFDYVKALKYYQYLYQEFSSDEEGVGGYFQMGICYSRMGSAKKAEEIFRNIMGMYPASRFAAKAKTQLDIDEIIKK